MAVFYITQMYYITFSTCVFHCSFIPRISYASSVFELYTFNVRGKITQRSKVIDLIIHFSVCTFISTVSLSTLRAAHEPVNE